MVFKGQVFQVKAAPKALFVSLGFSLLVDQTVVSTTSLLYPGAYASVCVSVYLNISSFSLWDSCLKTIQSGT